MAYLVRIWFKGQDYSEPQEVRLKTDNLVVTNGADGWTYLMVGKDNSKKLSELARYHAKCERWEVVEA